MRRSEAIGRNYFKFRATHLIFVSWSGFTAPARKEARQLFFTMRLWDSNAVIDNILENYEKLSEATKAELPLQRIWTLLADDAGLS